MGFQMNIICSASNSVRGLCLEDCSLFVGFCQEMANDDAGHWALGTGHLALASRVGSHDGLMPQKVGRTQSLVSAAFGEKGHCVGLAFPTRVSQTTNPRDAGIETSPVRAS